MLVVAVAMLGMAAEKGAIRQARGRETVGAGHEKFADFQPSVVWPDAA